jgi:hypothetical protein
MTGTSNPQSATSFRINLNGTTNINDISLVKIYYSGLSSQFSSANLFGSGAPATNNFLVEGNQALVGGDNYFWIAADVVTNAPIGNLLDAECIRVTVNGSQKTPAVTAPTGFRPIDIMQYQSATTLMAGSGFVNPGAQNAELIKLKVVTQGEPDPLVMESLSFSLAGTSNLADIDNIKIYYTGNDSTFSPDQLYATVAPGSGTLTVTAEKPLAAGSNYFWFTADVAVTASSGNKLDASCLGFTIGETAHAPSVSNPEGSRVIEAVYCTPQFYYGTSYGDYISLVSLGSINNNTGAAPYPYYNFYQTTTTELFRGNSYTLTVSAGTYSSNRIAAWIDYDQSGTFESWEKLGEVSLGARPASAGITFTIPDTAGYGYMRLRVREVFNTTDLDPCATYYYGETEDYRVEVYPDGLWLGASSEWNNPSNWYSGQVPGPSTSVLIPSPAEGEVLPTVFGGANPQCHDITIETGVSLVIPQGVTFTVHGGTSM